MIEIQVKERPILFQGNMVRAIIAKLKSQTRRKEGLEFINENPGCWQVQWVPDKAGKHWLFTCGDDRVQVRCPKGVEGDQLWVRETWGTDARLNGLPPNALFTVEGGNPVYYRADNKQPDTLDTWRPSIHMPRAASRLLLEITSVRVERLQAISEADAKAEGYTFQGFYELLDEDDQEGFDLLNEDYDEFAKRKGFSYQREWYRMLWGEINGPDSWHANPWVWMVEFKVVQPA